MTGPVKGFYKFADQAEWQNYQPFKAMPIIDFQDPNLRVIDLDGDGRPDLLVSEERAFRWYPCAGEQGYAQARMTSKAQDEESGPAIVFANDSESIFLADMSGDGLTDIVRIRNGSVAYWPNLGYGRFGAKVVMARAPTFLTRIFSIPATFAWPTWTAPALRILFISAKTSFSTG
jgi:hypothetical protein